MTAEFGSFKVVLSDVTGTVLPLDDNFLAPDDQVQYLRGVKLRQYVNATESRVRISLTIKKSFIFEGFDIILVSIFVDAGFEKCFLVDKTVLTAQNNDWTDSYELSAKRNSATSELDIAFWKFRYDGKSVPTSKQLDIPLSPFKNTHLALTAQIAGQLREWHLQRVDARPMATFTYICHLKYARSDEGVENLNDHTHDDASKIALGMPGPAVPPNDIGGGEIMGGSASDVEDVLRARSRMVYLCSICSKWRTSNNRISHYQRTHGLASAPPPTEPTRTLNDEEIAGARKTPAFRCILGCLVGAQTSRTPRPDAVNEADGRLPSECPPSPTQVHSEVRPPAIKEEIPSETDHFNHEVESAAVPTVKHEVNDSSIQQDELQKQDNIFRAISHVKRCMSPMRTTDTQDALAAKHERFAALSGVKRQISAYFQDRECKRSRNNGQLLIELSDDNDD